MQIATMQPLTEEVLTYSRHLYGVTSDAQTEFNETAEVRAVESSRRLQVLVDNASKSASAGSKSTTTLAKSALPTANNACDSVQRATKQVAELTESNLHAATSTAGKATAQAPAQACTATGRRSVATVA